MLASDSALAKDDTPVGIRDLEVLGSSYIVELCWPDRENPKVKRREEIKDLKNGQTVVILGDISKEVVKQERQEPK